jgi:uncharacterized protein (TIGR02145 family)
MDRNLGATQAATSIDDEASYGYLYQWGRLSDGHQSRGSETSYTLSISDVPGNGDFILANASPFDWCSPQNNKLWQGLSGINNPCPAGFRIPTEVELNAERISWTTQNGAGAFASPLKLPSAGDLYTTSINSAGTLGSYWSSSITGTKSFYLVFSTTTATGTYSDDRMRGKSVRCIKD